MLNLCNLLLSSMPEGSYSLQALALFQEQAKADDYKIATLIFSVLLIAVTWLRRKSLHEKALLPPGPWGLPLVGNLPFLEPDLHRCFAQLALRYGPVMKVQLRSRPCVVISSPQAAKEVLKEHDAIFADRDVSAAAFVCTYGALDIGFASYGDHWRMMRKVWVKELLNHGNLESLYGSRRTEVRDMVSKVYSKIGSSIDIGEYVHLAMTNIITSMMWGNTVDEEEKARVTFKFREAAQKMMELLGEANISDLFPVLAKFDIQGKERRMKEVVKLFDEIIEHVIQERRKTAVLEDKERTDFLQVLLQLIEQGEQRTPLTVIHLKALFVDMVLAGTKTISTTVEWAMAELLNRREIMKKAVDELDQIVGIDTMVEEIHLHKLPYLAAITKEVLRLHPAAPLLIPRCAREPSVVCGYLIPKGAKILVNAWAIQRDPKYWNDPLEFRPERFLNMSIDHDYNGNDFDYIPFGSGRRICVGLSLAEKLVPYLLASLLHSFNWEIPEGTELDLSEQFGIELKKKVPLIATPSPRLSDARLY